MDPNLAMEPKEVPQNTRENSPEARENANMSAASDVLEMRGLCGEIADRTAISHHVGSRIAAILDAFRPERKKRNAPLITENRATEFLRGKALRVDSWEKDIARSEVARLRAEQRQRENEQFLAHLGDTLAHLEASGAELHRSDIDVLRRTLSQVGALNSSVARAGAEGGAK